MDKVKHTLVTGGSGFVGHWTGLNAPVPHKESVSSLNHGAYDFGIWKSFKWDYIIHAAPIAPTEVLKIAERDNARVLYISSGIVYHPENDTEYRQNKMRWEQECLDSGVDVVIARLFTFYGRKLDEHKAYTQFKLAAEKGEPLRIWGDGRAIRSYMHGSEMARWLWAILLHGESGQAYDVGDDVPMTIYELAAKMAFTGSLIKNGPKFASKIIIENTVPDPMPIYLPTNTAKTKMLLSKV